MKHLFSIALLTLSILTSCITSEKKLKRRIEKHGIKESIGFVVSTYPEYFKKESVVVKDTIRFIDTVVVKEFTLDTIIDLYSESLEHFRFENERLRLELNKRTGVFRATVKHDTIYVEKVLHVEVKCPEITCPNVEDLKIDNKSNCFIKFLSGILLGVAFTYILFNFKKR